MKLWKTSTILSLAISIGLGTSFAQSPNGNTIMGDGAGQSLPGQTGSYNVLLGRQAGSGLRTGNYNMLIGNGAGQTLISGNGNVSIGDGAGLNMTGNNNTFLGEWAGMNTTTGIQNVMVGFGAGINSTMGAYNTFIGPFAGPDNTKPGLQYATAIGAYAQASMNNSIVLGGTKNAAGQPITINVGIGTSTPGALLDVAGNLRTTTGKFSSIYSQNTDGAYPSNVVNTLGDAQLSIGANWTGGYTDLSLINSNIANTSGGGFSFWQMTSATSKKMLTYMNGKGQMGIGGILEVSPYSMLQVYGPGGISSIGTGAEIRIRDQGSTRTTEPWLDEWSWYSKDNIARFSRPGLGDVMSFIGNGNVGIGTTTPETKFQLQSTTPMLLTGTGSGLKLRDWKSGAVPNADDWQIYASDNTMRFHKVMVGDIMAFANTGNVGIGTLNPGGYKLAVEGKIGAREVEVKTGAWADFVFAPTYRLRPLEEVATYITANKHLPEIPSEAEVKANGINLGAMDAKLLQKIEELTLYMIEQQKRIDKQQKQLDEQQRKIDRLSSRLD